jgi:hypothetical protein
LSAKAAGAGSIDCENCGAKTVEKPAMRHFYQFHLIDLLHPLG